MLLVRLHARYTVCIGCNPATRLSGDDQALPCAYTSSALANLSAHPRPASVRLNLQATNRDEVPSQPIGSRVTDMRSFACNINATSSTPRRQWQHIPVASLWQGFVDGQTCRQASPRRTITGGSSTIRRLATPSYTNTYRTRPTGGNLASLPGPMGYRVRHLAGMQIGPTERFFALPGLFVNPRVSM